MNYDLNEMNYDLNEAARHIVHDYAYLVAAGHDTQKNLPHPFNHYAERTFLVHCRTFAKFFDKPARKTRDMHAQDFINPSPISPSTNGTEQTWRRWHDHVDKHLAHLSKARIENPEPWTGDDNKKILKEFQDQWQDFYSKLMPAVRPAFDREIAKGSPDFPLKVAVLR